MHWQWAPVCAPVGAASGREPSWHRASRAGIARATLQKIEKGDPGLLAIRKGWRVGIGLHNECQNSQGDSMDISQPAD
jgi:hypothetical protein